MKYFFFLPDDREIPHFNDPPQAPDRFIRDDNQSLRMGGGNEAGRFVLTFRSGNALRQNAPPHSPLYIPEGACHPDHALA